MAELYESAGEILSQADALLITAGAGMGVDSGLPDFRGNEGFWKAYPPMCHLGISFSEMANPSWFDRDPELAWGFYGHRLRLYRETRPHEGFALLLEIAQQMPAGYFVFTSNVDGQFQKAGYDEDRIDECHGSIHFLQCSIPCERRIWANHTEVRVDLETFRAAGELPSCSHCSTIARPNVLMFGDGAWVSYRSHEQSGRLDRWLTSLRRDKSRLAVVEVGAGKAVPTVRITSENIARAHDAHLVRINPRDPEVPRSSDIGLPVGSLDGISRVHAQF